MKSGAEEGKWQIQLPTTSWVSGDTSPKDGSTETRVIPHFPARTQPVVSLPMWTKEHEGTRKELSFHLSLHPLNTSEVSLAFRGLGKKERDSSPYGHGCRKVPVSPPNQCFPLKCTFMVLPVPIWIWKGEWESSLSPQTQGAISSAVLLWWRNKRCSLLLLLVHIHIPGIQTPTSASIS